MPLSVFVLVPATAFEFARVLNEFHIQANPNVWNSDLALFTVQG